MLILQSIGTIEVNGQVGFPPQAALPIIMITLGSIVVFISFLGCCGAIRESVCMTMSYAVCLLVLLILQLTVVVLLFTNKDKFDNAMGEVIDKVWDNRETREGGVFDAIQKSVCTNYLQSPLVSTVLTFVPFQLHCCGRMGPQDYVGSVLTSGLPSSCCDGSCVNPLNIYGGCREKFVDLMSGSSEKAKYVGIGLIVVEVSSCLFLISVKFCI